MLRQSQGARVYREPVVLLNAEAAVDEYGHASVGEAVEVLRCMASVTQMSATKAMMTFQQADIVGLDIEIRYTPKEFNRILWRGHEVFFATPENVDMRCRTLRIQGYYQTNNPKI